MTRRAGSDDQDFALRWPGSDGDGAPGGDGSAEVDEPGVRPEVRVRLRARPGSPRPAEAPADELERLRRLVEELRAENEALRRLLSSPPA